MRSMPQAGRRRAAALALAGVLVSPIVPGAVVTAQSTNVVIEWNALASTTLITPANGTGAFVLLSIVQAAVYDAVNAIDGGYEPYLAAPVAADPGDSMDAAAATAAHHVLVALAPSQQATLDAAYATTLAGIAAGSAKTGGIEVGAASAAITLAVRTGDGRFGSFRFANPTDPGPGVWRPVLPAMANDPNAWVARTAPFLVRNADQFRSAGPLALTSRRYAHEFDEVKAYGSTTSTVRSADQTDQARFWADNPFALWGRIFRTVAMEAHLDVADTARLFARLYLTATDAQITVWADKARWNYWRPITAIREAATDGNPRTLEDPTWLPLIATPPYPDHPSGLAAVGCAIARTFRDFMGHDRVGLEVSSVFSGTTRRYTRFSQICHEIVNARVYAGIHFRNPDVQGAKIGKDLAKWADKHYFEPAW